MPVKFEIDDYLNHTFIETGSGSGENILKALHVGFHNIYGIESSPTLNATAHERIQSAINARPIRVSVTFLGGTPHVALKQACDLLQEPGVTILMNCYEYNEAPEGPTHGAARPLLDEIRILRQALADMLMVPVILISGVGQSNPPGQSSPPPIGDLINALLDLCEEYRFQIYDDHMHRNVLAALPPHWV